MKSLLRYITISLLIACALPSCGTKSKKSDAKPSIEEQKKLFSAPMPPSNINQEAQIEYLLSHYWDEFDFSDTAQLSTNTENIFHAFADYLLLLSPENYEQKIDSLMISASKSKATFLFFGEMANQALNDPNSPLRSSELYIPFLRAMLKNPLLDKYERVAPEFDLNMAMTNRRGEKATNFNFTTRSNSEMSLHQIDSEYTLLMFNNPDCQMCSEIIEEINQSPMLKELNENGRLKIVLLYPDEDLTAWGAYGKAIPQSWIYAYDKSRRLTEENLYDLRAIPSLYLLDKEKRVLLRDGVSIPIVEAIIDQHSSI